jgi:gliding motility-associated-like protein
MLLSSFLKNYGLATLLLAGAMPAGAQAITENFDDITTLTASGWATRNNSAPVGTSGWFQGSTASFTAFNGTGNSYIGANYQNTSPTGVGTISNWLIGPNRTLNNGDVIKFYTRIPSTGTEYPDRIELRVSTAAASTNVGTNETSVGDFTNLLLTVNPGLTTGVYPKVWTQFTATLSGLPASGVSGRFAIRYYVTDGGGNGSNSNYIGIDNLIYTPIPTCDPTQKPVVNFNVTNFCTGNTTSFTNTTTYSGGFPLTYTWSFGDAANSTATTSNASFLYPAAGTYTVKLKVQAQNCAAQVDSFSRTITLDQNVPGMMLPPVNAKFDFPTQLEARDITGASYVWDPPVMITSATIRNPVIRAQREQVYHITMNKPSGCVTVDTLLVRIFRDFDIQVPTAFSPNGDGSNDRLRPLTVGIASFRIFRVYDRLGREMFSTGTATQGWDGMKDGKMLPSDTYIWVAEGYDQQGGFVRRSGQVLLVR